MEQGSHNEICLELYSWYKPNLFGRLDCEEQAEMNKLMGS